MKVPAVSFGSWMTIAVSATSLGLSACEARPTSDTPLVRSQDSAGISAFTANWAATLRSTDTVSLREPVVRVGVLGGNSDYEFDQIVAIVPLAVRGFAVADGGRRDVRIFDWNGRLRASFGAEGDGPGEFRTITAAYAYHGDSIAVYDRRANRVTIFAAEGGEPRTFMPRVDNDGSRVEISGAFPDGRFLTRQRAFTEGDGLSRWPFTFMTYSALGEPLSLVGVFPGDEFFRHTSDGIVVSMRAPFPARTFASASDGEVIVADGATSGFTRWLPDGSQVGVWGSNEAQLRLEPSIREAHRDSLIDNNPFPPDMAESWAAAIRATPYPESVPFFVEMIAAPAGRVWLLRERPGEGRPVWAVVEPDGHLSRFVRSPEGLSILTVTTNRIFTVDTDELGVEYVEVYVWPVR